MAEAIHRLIRVLDLDRVAAWLEGRPLAPTRLSRFAAMAA
jgi:hypothetical protein